ncbi:hypothetical protein DFS34DRAFT_624283 [Phlyctochytrium arcticum]|nr:hypothetical protein DFS34DRAFT_624283 [Phlyctochytrium arcticum]
MSSSSNSVWPRLTGALGWGCRPAAPGICTESSSATSDSSSHASDSEPASIDINSDASESSNISVKYKEKDHHNDLMAEWEDRLARKALDDYPDMSDQELFYRLINIEHFPNVLTTARVFLEKQISIAKAMMARDLLKKNNLASAMAAHQGFCPKTLSTYMLASHQSTMQAYHDYMHQWDADMLASNNSLHTSNIMFPDRDYAHYWLVQNAPTKLVDGSWLQNTFSPQTPTPIRPFARPMFQTFAEELGEALPEQNHINVYNTCLASENLHLPPIHSRAFAYSPTFEPTAFTRGTLQLALGQFAGGDYFPEAMGYNFGYEQLPLHLLITTHEFRQMGLDYNYFLLHVTIDNAASGHAAMATQSVIDYLAFIEETEGLEARNTHWERILVGYYLAEINPLQPALDSRRAQHKRRYTPHSLPLTPASTTKPSPINSQQEPTLLTRKVQAIFTQKAPYAHKIHPPSLTLASIPLHTWLDPAHIHDNALPLVRALQDSEWIKKGDPNSPFLELCAFGREMFGVFTREEQRVLREWVLELGDTPALSTTPSSRQGVCPVSSLSTDDNNPKPASCPFSISQPTTPQTTKMLSLITTKLHGKSRHAHLPLTSSTGTTAPMSTYFDDPPAFLDALKASGYVDLSTSDISRLERAVNRGGCMAPWFKEEDREVVREWVEVGAPLSGLATSLEKNIAPAAETLYLSPTTSKEEEGDALPLPSLLPLPLTTLHPSTLYTLLQKTTPLSLYLAHHLLQTTPLPPHLPPTLPLNFTSIIPTLLSNLFSPKHHFGPLGTRLFTLRSFLVSLPSTESVPTMEDVDLANYFLALSLVGMVYPDQLMAGVHLLVREVLPTLPDVDLDELERVRGVLSL